MSVGDQVTVTIQQTSDTTWGIWLNDATGGGGFSEQTSFDGPMSSAEWIVEAGRDTNQCGQGVGGGVCPLAPYTNSSMSG